MRCRRRLKIWTPEITEGLRHLLKFEIVGAAQSFEITGQACFSISGGSEAADKMSLRAEAGQ
jgi:hypothetical protein